MKHALLRASLAAPFLALPVMALAATPEPTPVVHDTLTAIAAKVDPEALRATITHLVAFGTRHTLSDTASQTRGIGAARRWAKSRFEADNADCHGCLTIETPEQTFTGERLPNPAVVQDVIAIQRGTTDPQRVVIISGHIDSRNSDAMNADRDAPGANDDGSGTAAVLEAARVLSHHRFPATIVYAVLSGEEQGLYGGKILAAFAKTNGWRVEAQLNNDIIGNTHGSDGRMVDGYVRVFSEGVRADETPTQAAARRRAGGEVDSPSRELARFIQTLSPYAGQGFGARMILRADRFSRGGDQLPMQEAGNPAVRLTEADENYTRQHQDVRTEGGVNYGDVLSGVDFNYLA
jgi:acetylornithine deacetylase/succinyl-diaminopimelate desuccinylase-like protein